MAFLEVEHLKYRYPHTKKLALDDISFTAEKGEFIPERKILFGMK